MALGYAGVHPSRRFRSVRPTPSCDTEAVTVHPVAAGGFSSAASTYARIRPSYARRSVGSLLETVRDIGPRARVADVGAGTGILTGQLSRAGIDCVAVEPLPAMARQLRLALPEVSVALGVAEALPLADACVHAYTAAQAFHWFDPGAALDEAARVLAPGGWLFLIWNVRDETVPWVAALTALVESRAGGRPYEDHRDGSIEALVAASRRFGAVEASRHPNPVPAGVEAVVDRVRSTSFVASMDREPREALVAETRELLAEHGLVGEFAYPHETLSYRCRRLD